MKFLFSTDGHLSSTKPIARKEKTDADYIDTQINKRKQMYRYAYNNNVDYLIDGGDFFNAWNPKSLPALLNKLLPVMLKYKTSFKYILNIGNHDIQYHQLDFIKNSAIGILETMGLVEIVNTKNITARNGINIQIDFFHYSKPLEIRELKKGINIAVVHENIFEKSVPPYMSGYTVDGLRKVLPDYDLYLCGHNHQQFTIINKDFILINGGSIMRLNTKQKNLKPAFYCIDIENNISVEKIEFDIVPDMISTDHLKKNKIEAFVDSTEQFDQIDLFDFKKDVEREIEIQKPIKPVEKKILQNI